MATADQLFPPQAVGIDVSEDVELVAQCRAGRRESFDLLVRRYERPVYNVALRMTRNPEDARDVAQTAFLKAFERLNSYDPHYRFFSWLYRIAINEALDLRGRRRHFEPVDEQFPAGGPGPEAELDAVQQQQCIERAIAGMQPEYQSVLLLKHFADCSYEQIAATLELPEKTVKSRLYTARQLLREALARDGVS